MKTITINVSEPIYREFKDYARSHDRNTSELIREAMQDYLTQKMRRTSSLQDLEPLSLGRVIGDLSRRDDLLSEMLDDHRA